jgi:hypothetical protein
MRSLTKTLVAAAAALAMIGGAGVAGSAAQPVPNMHPATAQLVALSLEWPHCQPAGPKAGAFCWSRLAPASGQANSSTGGSRQSGDSAARPASSRS